MIQRTEISSVLEQIKATRNQLKLGTAANVEAVGGPSWQAAYAPSNPAEKVKEAPSFATLLKQAIDQVNSQQKTANDLRTRYELGDPDIDLVNVMIASQKASVSFEAMAQVRNKLVNSYQEIMRMPI